MLIVNVEMIGVDAITVDTLVEILNGIELVVHHRLREVDGPVLDDEVVRHTEINATEFDGVSAKARACQEIPAGPRNAQAGRSRAKVLKKAEQPVAGQILNRLVAEVQDFGADANAATDSLAAPEAAAVKAPTGFMPATALPIS